jgi:hypothetical protein
MPMIRTLCRRTHDLRRALRQLPRGETRRPSELAGTAAERPPSRAAANANGHTWHHIDRQLFDLTKSGVSGILPDYESDMPAFKSVLSDQQIWVTIAFIKTSWPKEIRSWQEQVNQNAR